MLLVLSLIIIKFKNAKQYDLSNWTLVFTHNKKYKQKVFKIVQFWQNNQKLEKHGL